MARLLTQRLRELEGEEFVERAVAPGTQPFVARSIAGREGAEPR